MKKLKDITISKFLNFKLSKEITNISLFEELRNIKNGQYKSIIINCRKAYNDGNIEDYNRFKTSLPSVTFSGVFNNSRKSSNLIFYNNLLVIDIDKLKLNELLEIKDKLKSDEYILSLWTSPSGFGLKGLIKVEGIPENHKFAFKEIAEYYKTKYSIDIDKSGSDLTRLCFTSWDKDIFYNPNSKVFEVNNQASIKFISTTKVQHKPISQSIIKSNSQRHINLIEDILCFLELKKTTITSDYLNWRNVALAISNTFSQDLGIIYFLRFSRLDGKLHDEEKSKSLIINMYQQSNSSNVKITIRTVNYLAEQKGYKRSLKSLLDKF